MSTDFQKSSLGGLFYFERSVSRLSFTPDRMAALITCCYVGISWFVFMFSYTLSVYMLEVGSGMYYFDQSSLPCLLVASQGKQ